MGGFWDSDLVKNFEKGKLPTVDTAVSFDVETIAIIVMIILIAVILGFVMYRLVLK